MSYESRADINNADPPVAVVEESEPVNAPIPLSSSQTNVDPNVIVIDSTQSLTVAVQVDIESSVSSTTPSRKRRQKAKELTPPTPKRVKVYDEEDDNGSTCPICLDTWEIVGAHRLVALKCGHLFGESCLRRWFSENKTIKNCPTCKQKATNRDMRYIYAKKVCAIDKSDENQYKEALEKEKLITSEQKKEIGALKLEIKIQTEVVHRLEREIGMLKNSSRNISEYVASTSVIMPPKVYKLFMEKNIEISKDGGCKVLLYGKRVESLIATQKSSQYLFPGFGMRFIDFRTFRPTQYLHTSTKQIRDISLDKGEEHVVATSLDKGAKMFNLNQRRAVCAFAADDKVFWGAAFDCDRANSLYLGSQHGGSTYVYDIRNPQTFVDELKVDGDSSPVCKISPVPARDDFPFGGFFVCKLSSVWFYEYDASQQLTGTKLFSDGPFVSMNYEHQTKLMLISARPSVNHSRARYIIAELVKIDDAITIRILGTCFGSSVQSVMTRSTQIRVSEKNTVVAAYLEDKKSLSTWSAPSCIELPPTTLNSLVSDLCPLYLNGSAYLSALSDTRFRLYHLQIVNEGHY